MNQSSANRQCERFDFEATLGRMGGDFALFVKMIEYFCDDSGPLLHQIASGIHECRARTVEQAAHSLKGLLANFSAESAVVAAARLEQAGREGDLTGGDFLLEELRSEVRLLHGELDGFRPTDSGE
jgi:HPt (histidine-containing phosphotransfer) domain-containing protein